MRAFRETPANLHLMLVQEIINKFLAEIAGDVIDRVHKAKGGRRDDRLLQSYMCVALGHIQVAIRGKFVPKWSAGEPRHSADMPGGEWDLESIWRRVGQSMYAIRPEVLILALLAVRDDWGTGRLKLLDGVSNSFIK